MKTPAMTGLGGIGMVEIKTEIENGKVYAHTSINETFINKIKREGGVWDPLKRAWYLAARREDEMKEILFKTYGYVGIPDETVDVKITINENGIVRPTCKTHFTCFGLPVFSVFGRDSGAKESEYVEVLLGSATSGGSAKYWKMIIEPDTTFILKNVPKVSVDKKINFQKNWGTYEILEPLKG